MKFIINHELVHLLHQQTRLLEKEANATLSEYELYSAQWAIIYCLSTQGPMVQADIGKYLNVEAPTVTRTLRRMEENDWVVREEGEDKRERLVRLSPRGESELPAIKRSMQQMEATLLRDLNQEEKEQLYHLLWKINGDRDTV